MRLAKFELRLLCGRWALNSSLVQHLVKVVPLFAQCSLYFAMLLLLAVRLFETLVVVVVAVAVAAAAVVAVAAAFRLRPSEM